jgi:hypothetical protein
VTRDTEKVIHWLLSFGLAGGIFGGLMVTLSNHWIMWLTMPLGALSWVIIMTVCIKALLLHNQ